MSQHSTPKWANRFLKSILSEELREEVQGDLEELYNSRVEERGRKYAGRRYFWDTLKCIRLINTKEFSHGNTSGILLLSYFRTGFRFLWKTRNYSSINIIGLAFGITAACLGNLFITDQFSYDRFHPKIDRLYRVAMEITMRGDTQKDGGASYIMGEKYKAGIPGIERLSRVKSEYGIILNKDENQEQKFHYVDPDIFEMLDFEWIRGSGEGFGDPSKVIVSKSFYEEIGKKQEFSISIQGEEKRFTILAVIKDMPINSTFYPKLLVPFSIWTTTVHERRTKTWLDINMNLIVLRKENSRVEDINILMTKMMSDGDSENDHDIKVDLYLQRFDKIHTDTSIRTGNGLKAAISEDILWVVSIVGILCLLISSLNYSNFSLGHFLIRSREVGVRKILGARVHFIWQQFFVETFISTFLALCIAVFLTIFLLPYFSEFVGVNYSLHDLFKVKFLGGCLAILAFTTFLSGGYPSLILAKFKMVNTIKGSQKVGGRNLVSRIFLTTQIGLAVFLIIGTITVNQQLNFLLNYDLGYNDERVIMMYLPRLKEDQIERFRSKVEEVPGVQSFSVNSDYNGTGLRGDFEKVKVRHIHIDETFVDLLELKLSRGRLFNPDLQSDQNNAVLINQTLEKVLDFEDPIGQILPFDYGDLKNPEIIGVLEDYHFRAPKYEQNPLVMYLSPQFPFQVALIKLKPNYSAAHINMVEKAWNNIFSPNHFDFAWLEDQNERRMKTEARIRNVALAGSGIAIMLVIFGLLSVLGTYIQQRMKEIVIRKINGSKPFDLFLLFFRRFSTWLFLGFLMGVWPAYYFLQLWLNDYAFRIDINYWIGFLALGICSLVFLSILIIQLLKVVRVNPVVYLNDE